MIKRITLTGMLALSLLFSFAKEYKQAAIEYLKKNPATLNLSEQDIKDLILLDDSYDDFSNVNRVWFQQSAYGIPLKSGMVSVHFMNGKVINSNSSGVLDLKKQISTVNPALSPEEAIRRAASYVGVTNVGKIELQEKVNKKDKLYIFKPVEGLSNIEIHVELLLARNNQGKVFLNWEVQFHSLDDKNFWNIDINANDGSLINKADQIIHCDFGTGTFLGAQNTSIEYNRLIDDVLPVGAGDDIQQPTANSYNVYPYNVESPPYGARQLLTNPADATASPFGWHDTNGSAGAEFTVTRGNNVNAYADKNGDNTADAGSQPDGGANLDFNFNLNFASKLDTLENSKAVVTQLFYMNNVIHDIMFKMGFTETSRNFQARHYTTPTQTGANDFVWAEAHDGTLANPRNTNNANFATSADGVNTAFSRSRMQMFMWDGGGEVSLTYNAPASIAGAIDSIGQQSGWGPCNFNVTGPVVNATSATAPANFVCGAVNNGSEVAGKIALIDRGGCDFSAKVFNAQQAGAIGVIIINRQSAGDSLLNMSGGANASGVTIPAVIVKYTDGQKLRNNLATANVTLFRQSPNNCLDLDGSLDNGIVAHEYGHGISTRLTGLNRGQGGTSACLSNAEQAGEGWSDFFALILTRKAADTKNTPRGIGNYAIGLGTTGQGIRRYPYCYDMSVNPQTYNNLFDEEDIYLTGEIWCSALWDMYWELVEAHGYTPDFYTGNGGNVRALKLVIEGLKQQPCNPGLIDARNGVLKADTVLYGGANSCLIWKAFARRGMGASALQGSSGNALDQTPAFNEPAACNTTPTATASFTSSDTTVCAGGSLTFTNTSTASSGSPDSVRWTIPGGVPGTSTSTTTVNATFSTPGTYIVSLVAYKSGNASTAATKSIRVKSLPTVGVNSPTICSGSTATLTGTGATTYTWTGGLSGSPSAVTPVLTTTTTYTVTGNTQGCTGTAVSTVTVNPRPTVTVNSPTICSGTTASLTAGGATTYSWTGGLTGVSNPTTPVLTTTTTYTVTGTLNGCTNTAVATVTVTPLPNVTVNSPGICTGQTATLNASGATTYSWSTGASGSSISVSPSSTTTYTVTGTTGGCTKSATATVAVSSPPTVSVNSPTICAGQTATLTANGATSYTWTGGLSGIPSVVTPVLTTTTTYTVTGTTSGCSSTAVSTVTVNPSPTVSVNSPTICSGQTASLTATGATSYSWTGGLSGSNPTTPVLTNTTTYTVTGTLNGCTGTAVSTVSVTALPNVTVTSPSICSGSTATLSASGATSYTWTGGLAATSNPTTPVLTTTTTYTVTGTTGSCSKTAVSTVTVNATAPTVSISSNPSPASVCTGESITLTANGANNYTWTSSQTGTTSGTTLSFTPSADITVNLSGTVTGCTTAGTTSINITVKGRPTVSVNSPSICSGSTASLSASGAVGYSWTGGLTAVSNPTTPALTTTTTYTVTGTTNGCTNTAVSTVTVTGAPSVSVNSPSICSGNTASLSASGASSYSWTGGLASVSNPTTPVLSTTTTYTVTGSNGSCSGTAVSTVTVNPTPATPSITQSNDTLYSSTIVVGASYQWFKGGVLQTTTSVPYYKLTSSGSYTVKVISGLCTSAESAVFSATFTSIRNATNSIKIFEVYPNPTEGRLIVNLGLTKNASVQLRIFTAEGREMYVKSFSNTRAVFEELSLQEFAKGMYMIKLNVDDEVYYHKVVKQ